jgi:histidinol-phosphate aminotransferase
MTEPEPEILGRARQNIRGMIPFASARALAQSDDNTVFLDANECPYEPLPDSFGYARYADQQPAPLRARFAGMYGVREESILITRGADEVIDLLVRTFCEPGADSILISTPTFPVYGHAARIQDARVIDVPLEPETFALDRAAMLAQADNPAIKIVFICSPNNPTGNLLDVQSIHDILRAFAGKALVVVDEPYIEMSGAQSFAAHLDTYPHLAVLRTLSKAYASAGIRCGCMLAHPAVTALVRKIVQAYPVPVPVLQAAMAITAADNLARLERERRALMDTRDFTAAALSKCAQVEKVYHSDTNFLLIRAKDGEAFFQTCLEGGYSVRKQFALPGLENCLRIAIGTRADMEGLIRLF